MRKFLYFQFFAFALFFTGCDAESFARKSGLPETMPADFEAKFTEGGGFSPKYHSIRLDANTLYVEKKDSDSPERAERSAEVSEADRAALYKAFVENEFDLITYETTDIYTSDAVIRSISLRANGKLYTHQLDPNKPLSELNRNRFENVLTALKNLENKYQSRVNQPELQYAVLKVDSDDLRYIADDSYPAELDDDEIEKSVFFVKEIVSEKIIEPKTERRLLPLADYKFQFVPYVDENGIKNVYVNAFCDDFETDWTKIPVIVEDGGRCYFNFKINLKNSTTYDFSVNGEA